MRLLVAEVLCAIGVRTGWVEVCLLSAGLKQVSCHWLKPAECVLQIFAVCPTMRGAKGVRIQIESRPPGSWSFICGVVHVKSSCGAVVFPSHPLKMSTTTLKYLSRTTFGVFYVLGAD